MNLGAISLRVAVAVLASVSMLDRPALAQSRGELLYANHCIACHTVQVHWRDKRAATDWASLKVLVRRWQASALLGWSDADVTEVARYLNERIYRFVPGPGPAVSSQPAAGRARAA